MRIEQLTAEVEELRRLQRAQYETARQQPSSVDAAARDAIIHRAQRPAPLNEVQARVAIDKTLAAAGWEIQGRDQVAPTAKLGVAVREFTSLPSAPAMSCVPKARS
ncbi:hypothetical protein [Streptomyces albofaciens]|uniref:hypothetical protein n=1 Tax=Streptomyces albofaciens TaxID=66866 RepID=UPI00123B2702|nr:hypothetical protein [Streptomyces albofaciens]